MPTKLSSLGNSAGAAGTDKLVTAVSGGTPDLLTSVTQIVTYLTGLTNTWSLLNTFTSGIGVGADITLVRNAAGELAQRSGATAQIFQVYQSFTDASNYSRLEMGSEFGAMYIRQVKAGTGTAFDLRLNSKDADLVFGTGDTNMWKVAVTTGHLLAVTDATYDIGASGATRPRSLYVSTSVVTPLITATTNGSVLIGSESNGQRLGIKTLTELTTIAAAATTDTTIQIPANALVLGVSVRVTVVIPTAATFDIGIAGATTRYGTGISTAANTTNPGTNDAVRFYSAATAIRFTPNASPADNSGRVRVTIHYIDITPPTA